MTLRIVRISETLLLRRLPRPIARMLKRAERRIETYQHRVAKEGRSTPFIPSDYVVVYQWLRAIAQKNLATGDAFLEWGSGFGVIAMLAETLGFEAYGIESEPDLVAQAEELARDLGSDAVFACGSFIPEGGESLVDDLDDVERLDLAAAPAFDDLDRGPRDFDLVFGYPWPGHDRFLEDLFDHFASPGALLLMYRGLEDVRLYRKR